MAKQRLLIRKPFLFSLLNFMQFRLHRSMISISVFLPYTILDALESAGRR